MDGGNSAYSSILAIEKACTAMKCSKGNPSEAEPQVRGAVSPADILKSAFHSLSSQPAKLPSEPLEDLLLSTRIILSLMY